MHYRVHRSMGAVKGGGGVATSSANSVQGAANWEPKESKCTFKKSFSALNFYIIELIKRKTNKYYRFFFLNTIIFVWGVNWNSSARSSKNRNYASAQTPTVVPFPAQVQSI